MYVTVVEPNPNMLPGSLSDVTIGVLASSVAVGGSQVTATSDEVGGKVASTSDGQFVSSGPGLISPIYIKKRFLMN